MLIFVSMLTVYFMYILFYVLFYVYTINIFPWIKYM